jgi:hypothetical protein
MNRRDDSRTPGYATDNVNIVEVRRRREEETVYNIPPGGRIAAKKIHKCRIPLKIPRECKLEHETTDPIR